MNSFRQEEMVPLDIDSGEELRPDWWAPIWKGLVLDKRGKHYQAVGSALWLYVYCILCANRKTGFLKRKIGTIGQEMGIKTRSIRRWLKVLQRGNYIETRTNGRCLAITVCRWRSLPSRSVATSRNDPLMPRSGANYGPSPRRGEGQISSQPSQELATTLANNDITIKKDMFKNDNVGEQAYDRDDRKAVAVRISRALQDESNLPLYIAYVRQYPPELIQRAFEEAMKPPAIKIKKTRGALFNYLVKYYARE